MTFLLDYYNHVAHIRAKAKEFRETIDDLENLDVPQNGFTTELEAMFGDGYTVEFYADTNEAYYLVRWTDEVGKQEEYKLEAEAVS